MAVKVCKLLCLLSFLVYYSYGFISVTSTILTTNPHRMNLKRKHIINTNHPYGAILTMRDMSFSASQGYIPTTTTTTSSVSVISTIIPDMYNNMDNGEFASLIKTLASKRKPLNQTQKTDIIRHLFSILYTLNMEQLCDCIWSIGTLSIRSNDLSSSQLQQLVDVVDTIHSDEKQLLKSFSGLSKMGIKWIELSEMKRNDFLNRFLTVLDNSVDARETATLVYTLGQLGCSKDILTIDQSNVLFNRISSTIGACSGQGLANAFHGLAKSGYIWTDLPPDLQYSLCMASTQLMPSMMIGIELSSILNSLALMKSKWEELPESFQECAITCLQKSVGSYNAREISNAFWFMGKLNVKYESLSLDFREEFLRVLQRESNRLQAFDIESLLVGLGLMQVEFTTLNVNLRNLILKKIEDSLDGLNIFSVNNVLWGLARMGTTTHDMNSTLAASLLDKTVFILHTFLPTHYGDVLWSLGSLGYLAKDMDKDVKDRLLAVISRVFAKLHVRAAAYALWGLGKMGFTWKDMQMRTRSLAGGREAPPLEESVCIFLRKRVASMKEHEYAVLLYAFGMLELDYPTLPDYIREKIDHRASRVASFLTGRSTSNSLYGLGKSRARWHQLSQEARDAWEQSLTSTKGIPDMNAFELAQTLYSLGLLNTKWSTINSMLKLNIIKAIDSRCIEMSDHGFSTCIWGLGTMGCDGNSLPPTIKDKISQLFQQSISILSSTDSRGIALSYSLTLQAVDLLRLKLSPTDAAHIVVSANNMLEYMEGDMLADLLTSLFNLKLFESNENMDLKTKLLLKLKTSSSTIPPSKLSVLSSILQKLQ